MEYIEIKEQIKQKLPVARDLGDSENLLELGLSSLTIMRLVNQWRKQGVKVSFGSLMENPTLEGWWALIQRSMKKKAGKKRAQESKITPEKDMKQPFPLTDVQYAYWVGRDEEQALGGIDCHAYLEFDGGTVLNLVPAQMEMYMAYLQTTEYKLDTLRLILLSGDWIPVKLVEKIHQKMPNVQCISLGGATEGGIWSIYYPTDRVKSTDKNIPYGIPLSNQRFYILNEKNLPCLDYVIGEICIAGKSLAKGYMNDVTLSDQKFQFITEIEERVYKTGDLGLYREDGVIEFVGRKDTQVKINGYRVELGEIENALKRYPGIENAVVVKSNEGSLTAYILGNKGKQEKKVIEKKIIDEEKEFKFQFTRKEFQEWIEKADKTALMYILRFLVNEKVFEDVEKRYSFEQIKGILNVIPKYEQLLMRWLMALKENKYLHLDKEGFYIEEIYSTNIAEKAEEEWKLVDKKIQYSDVLMEYIHESSMHLKELITGVMHPNELLFPQGNFDIAYAAYKDNIVNRSINRILHNEVLEIIKQQKKKKIRILEVGAGVGGSSIELLSKIQSCNVEYYFTDISNFFFNEAKVIFSQYNDWIRYKIYDINKSNWEQGFENEKFDIILCGNVLHNAVDIKNSKSADSDERRCAACLFAESI